MNKRIIAALLIIAFAAAGVAAGAAAARYKDDLERPTSGDANDVTHEPPTGNTDNVSGTESADQAAEPETQESEPQETEVITEPVTQEPVTEPEPDEPEQPKFIWPDESYVGAWREHVNGNPEFYVLAVTQDKILISMSYYRQWGFEVTAIEKDGEIVFGSEVSPDFIHGPEGLNGKLIFDGDRIIMIFDNHFEEEIPDFNGNPAFYNGPIYYNFDYKTEMEKEIIEAHLKYSNAKLDDEPEPEPESVTESEPEPQSEAERKKAEIVKADEEWAMQNRVIPDVIPKFDAGSMKIYSAKEANDKIPLVCGLYRAAYYATPQRLVNSVSNSRIYTWWDETLVDFDEYCDWWYENIVPKIESPGEPNEMYIVSFIKHFRIPKEDFEKACEDERLRLEKLRDENGVDISSEEYEIPNADIIYTFDNDIINEYYRR